MDLADAVEVFAKGFSTCKSRTWPYVAEFRSGIWVMRDGAPRRIPRAIELLGCGEEPIDLIAAARSLDLGRHFFCSIYPPEADAASVKKTFKANGYRALSTQWLFTHNLLKIANHASDPPVRLVTSEEEMDAIPQIVSQPRKYLAGSRQFGIWDEHRDYGWVRSVPVGENAYVSDLYVFEEFRRRGYGSALMSALLQSDKASGVRNSVLVASTAGAKLYPQLGYELVGELQMFVTVHG